MNKNFFKDLFGPFPHKSSLMTSEDLEYNINELFFVFYLYLFLITTIAIGKHVNSLPKIKIFLCSAQWLILA